MKFTSLIPSAVALLSLSFAPAAFALCEGDNLLDTLSQDAQDQLAAVSQEPFARGRFWEVEKDGAVSVLFGTMHLPEEKYSAVPLALQKRIETARLVMIEITIEEEKRGEKLLVGPPSIMRNPDGRRISDALSDEDWQTVQDAASGYGLTGPVMDQLEPWFIGMMLSIPKCVMLAQMRGDQILDRNIESYAHSNNVPVEGLEPFEEVLDVLRSGTYEENTEQLVMAAASVDFSEDFLATMITLYAKGDIQAIWTLSEILTVDILGEEALEIMDDSYDKLLAQRNANWADTLIPALKKGDVVVAVGAMHLPGPAGLLPMLEAEGFALRPLNE